MQTCSNSSLLHRIQGCDLTLEYEDCAVFRGLDVAIPDGEVTVIIGPNGCGKSTLLKTLCRLFNPTQGQVYLDEKAVSQFSQKSFAQQVGLLPQRASAPEGIRVKDLVSRGRYPYQRLFKQWTTDDELAVREAMALTGVAPLAERAVDTLSGGQRQRVWIAMVLAQQTPIVFLDEPTTYLDIAHQFELLELCRQLNREQGRTIVIVLHELNQAFRYADQLIVMFEGRIAAQGVPEAIVSPQMIRQVFDLDCVIISDPIANTPMIVPYAKHST